MTAPALRVTTAHDLPIQALPHGDSMNDFWCLLFGCGGSSAHDVARAAPEIAGAVLGNAVALVAGGLALLDGRRTNGGRRRKTTCHAGHDLTRGYLRRDGTRYCRDCQTARQRDYYAARMLRRWKEQHQWLT